jgi:beta-fructofuranosidase
VLLDALDLPTHHRPRGVAWECPQLLLDASGRALLVVSVWYPERLDHVAWVSGYLDGDRLVAQHSGRLDDGPDFYAPAVTVDAATRWLMWGWSPEARPAEQSLSDGWAGLLTAPRVLALDDDGAPRQSFVPALISLRSEQSGSVDARGSDAEVAVLAADAGDVLDVEAQLMPPPHEGSVTLAVLRSPDDAERTLVRVHHDGTVELDRSAASLDPAVAGGAAVSPPRPGRAPTLLGLRVLVDRSVVEVLTDDGRALTMRVYPTRADACGLAVSGDGGRWSARVSWWRLTTPVLVD